MVDRLKRTLRRGVDGFKSFSGGQKAVIVIAVLALAIGGYFFASWASKPTMAPLFSNLAATDASAIVEKLGAANVKYELADGGATIMVPQDQVYDLRLQMAGQGLPAGEDTGYSLLDKQGVTTSEFMQHVSYQRALEGELASTIQSIDGVEAATVHLALPQKDVFADDQQKPTASVLVKTAAGKDLTDNQVQAIINLVSSSIEGMDSKDVTLAGADGSVLAKGGETTTAAGGDASSKRTETFEDDMQDSLREMLEQVVGKGHAAVTVTADLDYDNTQTKSQTYNSDANTQPLAESKKSETFTGNGNAVGGVLGPDNIQVPSGSTGSNNSYENSTETKNNAVNSVTETRQSAPGAIRKMGIAVLLDSNIAASANTAKIQTLVQSAAALDSTRGDSLAVTSLPFDQSAAKAAAKELAASQAATKQAELMSTVKSGAAIGLIALLMLIAAFVGRRNRKKQSRTMLTASERLQLEEMQAALERERAREIEASTATPAAIEAGPTRLGPDKATRQKEIAAMVEKQPEEVAQLLRTWLGDRREVSR
ncbi:flagellar basal-body MS-ring/collar protein FliF [Cryptosporangium sp. NPDC051539]|uniref:flagellar basal-body MS-ring/collar protein FliF n=1 Tax=Cryptosporangium sp. NPDC051539 TaxID=3363962 RepID=UPI00379EEC06